MAKSKPESWKNLENYNKGKGKLENAILQHPEEDSKTSMYDFMKRNISRRLWVKPYKDFKMGDK